MFKNCARDGKRNICGKNVKRYRLELPNKPSQRALAYYLQLRGIDLEKNAVQRIESGKRFVTDIELKELACVLNVTVAELLESDT